MLISYLCKTCSNSIDKLISNPEDIKGVIPCLDCGGFLERIITGPNSNSVEVIDTGYMTNTVEYDSNRASMRKEASDKFFREKDRK